MTDESFKPPVTEFERGKEAGRVAQILHQHGQHLAKINGSIDDSARALDGLTLEIRELRQSEAVREATDKKLDRLLAGQKHERRQRLSILLAYAAPVTAALIGAGAVLLAGGGR
jgi:hypothetical protein